LVVKMAGMVDKDLGSVANRLGQKHDFTSAKAQNQLGWRPRPIEETVLDCARSLIAEGLVPALKPAHPSEDRTPESARP